MRGADGVFHVAAPMNQVGGSLDEMFVPAMECTLELMRGYVREAQRRGRGLKVVMTSSDVAVVHSGMVEGVNLRRFDERDWNSTADLFHSFVFSLYD